jgi:acyl homoserine lactone synthase
MEASLFTAIRPLESIGGDSLSRQYYRLRKHVFHDVLAWDVIAKNNQEIDEYDALSPLYVAWCSDDLQQLYGGVRLLPTDGPTLLRDVFQKTCPAEAMPCDAAIFEATRMCVDERVIEERFDGMKPARAISLMLAALCECGLAIGAKSMVSNFEAPMRRVYRRAGLEPKILGHADGYGKRPVYCGQFDINSDLLKAIRASLGLDFPIFVHLPTVLKAARPLNDMAA